MRGREEIAIEPKLTQARIAAREGLSRARVTQVMNLLQLPTEIQQQLESPPRPLTIDDFSERRLRVLLADGSKESQLRAWQIWLSELKHGPGN